VRQHVGAIVRSIAGDRGRSVARRATVQFGLRPRANLAAAHSCTYPGGRRAAVIISADLELAWAWRYAHVPSPRMYARERADQGRRNLGVILDLCDLYELPITWVTIGHLLLDSCPRSGSKRHIELPRIPYFTNHLWTYQTGDWFDDDPGSAGPCHPEWRTWYGPDLIESILRRRVAHEIACHTFSHVPFTDEHCPPEVAASELRRCQQAASRFGIALRSFVFPGNLSGNHARLHEGGFAAYRHRSGWELDAPHRDAHGLWRIPEGLSLEKPFRSWSAGQQVWTVQRYIDVAIERGLVCGLWFHPETEPCNVDDVFPAVFAYLASRRCDVWVGTMGELAQWMNGHASASLNAAGAARELA
jgi:hypothetical protein